MICEMGTEINEERVRWKYSENDEWKSAEIDELIDAYEHSDVAYLEREIYDLRRELEFLKDMQKYTITNGTNTYIPPACRGCSNHPSNGGSGICHCTLGGYTIT